MQGIFSALLDLALFWHVGEVDMHKLQTDYGYYGRFVGNLLGLAFMLANSICFSSSSGVIMQMPL
jgi:hypothetical protein